MSYGQWLRQKRKELRLTQADVEQRAKVGRNSLSKIENDIRRPAYETRMEIHRVLNTSEQDLFDLGILVRLGSSNSFDWPRSRNTIASPGDKPITRSDAINQIRFVAADMKWTQSMLDTVLQQIRLFRELQRVSSRDDEGQ